jgi:hypothetical protein
MFDKIKSIFKKPEPIQEPVKAEPKIKKPRKPKQPKVEKVLSEKEKATLAGEPYIAITKVDIDPNDIHNGSFEFDWNDKFIINLIKAGYKQKDTDTDDIIVDRYFQVVCRNIALEVYEQVQADPDNRDVRPIRTRDLGNGRTEVS